MHKTPALGAYEFVQVNQAVRQRHEIISAHPEMPDGQKHHFRMEINYYQYLLGVGMGFEKALRRRFETDADREPDHDEKRPVGSFAEFRFSR